MLAYLLFHMQVEAQTTSVAYRGWDAGYFLENIQQSYTKASFKRGVGVLAILSHMRRHTWYTTGVSQAPRKS